MPRSFRTQSTELLMVLVLLARAVPLNHPRTISTECAICRHPLGGSPASPGWFHVSFPSESADAPPLPPGCSEAWRLMRKSLAFEAQLLVIPDQWVSWYSLPFCYSGRIISTEIIEDTGDGTCIMHPLGQNQVFPHAAQTGRVKCCLDVPKAGLLAQRQISRK